MFEQELLLEVLLLKTPWATWKRKVEVAEIRRMRRLQVKCC
jgi:hypothetical protein